jgi:uncharacterized membrane protein YgcG
VKLFEKWGIGEKSKDNGLLMLICTDPRQIKIEVGYGLDGDLTDGTIGQILDDHMVPFLRKNQWSEAVASGVQGIIDRLGDKPIAQRQAEKAERARQEAIMRAQAAASAWLFFKTVILILIIVVPIALFFVNRARRRAEEEERQRLIPESTTLKTSLVAKIWKLAESSPDVAEKLSNLRKKYFPEDWRSVWSDYKTADESLQKIELAVAKMKISPEISLTDIRSIHEALSNYSVRVDGLDPRKLVEKLELKRLERETAEQRARELFASLPQKFKVARAHKEARNAEELISNAETNFANAKKATDPNLKGNIIDWLAVRGTLNDVSQLLDRAMTPPPPPPPVIISSSKDYSYGEHSRNDSFGGGSSGGSFGGGRSGGGGATRSF